MRHLQREAFSWEAVPWSCSQGCGNSPPPPSAPQTGSRSRGGGERKPKPNPTHDCVFLFAKAKDITVGHVHTPTDTPHPTPTPQTGVSCVFSALPLPSEGRPDVFNHSFLGYFMMRFSILRKATVNIFIHVSLSFIFFL